MTLRAKLKQETRLLHKQLELHSNFQKLFRLKMSFLEYQKLITKLYGFIVPCEEQLKIFNTSPIYSGRTKKTALDADLLSLGITSSHHIVHCTKLPALTQFSHVLGYLYVIEGSTLGGQIITQALQKHPWFTHKIGTNYFNCYGDKTVWWWKKFYHALNKYKDDKIITCEAISTAKDTFLTLGLWLNED